MTEYNRMQLNVNASQPTFMETSKTGSSPIRTGSPFDPKRRKNSPKKTMGPRNEAGTSTTEL